MPLIEIIAVGGLIQLEGQDTYRAVVRGAHVNVSKEDAELFVAQGTAKYVDQSRAADAEGPQPDPGAINLEEGGSTVEELRKFASARRINLGGAQKRAEIVDAIKAAETPPAGA